MLGAEAHSERRMTFDQDTQGAFERRGIERAAHPRPAGEDVGGATRSQTVEKPERSLSVGEGRGGYVCSRLANRGCRFSRSFCRKLLRQARRDLTDGRSGEQPGER